MNKLPDGFVYIRFGEIPKDERSGIFDDIGPIGEEKGVSVFYGTVLFGKYHIILPNPCSQSIGKTIHNIMNKLSEGKIRVYTFDADCVGIGSDGEPVVRNISNKMDITSYFDSM